MSTDHGEVATGKGKHFNTKASLRVQQDIYPLRSSDIKSYKWVWPRSWALLSVCIMFSTYNVILRQPGVSWLFFQSAKIKKAGSCCSIASFLLQDVSHSTCPGPVLIYLDINWISGKLVEVVHFSFGLGFSPSPNVPCLLIHMRAVLLNTTWKYMSRGSWEQVAWELWRAKRATVVPIVLCSN